MNPFDKRALEAQVDELRKPSRTASNVLDVKEVADMSGPVLKSDLAGTIEPTLESKSDMKSSENPIERLSVKNKNLNIHGKDIEAPS